LRNYAFRNTVLAQRVNNWTASVTPPADERPHRALLETWTEPLWRIGIAWNRNSEKLPLISRLLKVVQAVVGKHSMAGEPVRYLAPGK
jgi:hypothetical protein